MLKNNSYLTISTDGLIEIKTFDPLNEDVNDVIHAALDSYYEIVRCRTLPHKFLMLVDDCGVLKSLPVNALASELYGVRVHGCPICGPAVIMREDIVDGEPDIVGLTEDDTAELVRILRGLFVIREVNEND